MQVRFESVSDYAPGEAQMIFRLGYDPEVLQLRLSDELLASDEFEDLARAYKYNTVQRVVLDVDQRLTFNKAEVENLRSGKAEFGGISSHEEGVSLACFPTS